MQMREWFQSLVPVLCMSSWTKMHSVLNISLALLVTATMLLRHKFYLNCIYLNQNLHEHEIWIIRKLKIFWWFLSCPFSIVHLSWAPCKQFCSYNSIQRLFFFFYRHLYRDSSKHCYNTGCTCTEIWWISGP